MAEDITRALDRLQSTAENLIAFETNRRIQLGREKEARMVQAYQYLLDNENTEIGELETVLDSIALNLKTRGVEFTNLNDEYKTIDGPALFEAANQGAAELVNAKLEDRQNYRDSLQKKKTDAMQIARTIDLYDDALTLIDPAYGEEGDKKIIDAGDVAVAQDKFWNTLDEELKQEELGMKGYIKERTEYLQTPEGLEGLREANKADHLSAIQAYEIPRQHALDVVKMRTQDPAMVLSRHYRSIGVLRAQRAEETVPSKQKVLDEEIQNQYANLGSLLYPQLKDHKGNWVTPTPETSANMAQELSESLLLLQKDADPTEFVAYLENVQLYYDEMKKDDSEEGRAVSDRVRSEVLNLLGIDLEALIQFGDEFLTDIDLILRAYNEVERIDLEQLFHGELLESAIPSNVNFDPLDPLDTSSKADIFGKAKLKK